MYRNRQQKCAELLLRPIYDAVYSIFYSNHVGDSGFFSKVRENISDPFFDILELTPHRRKLLLTSEQKLLDGLHTGINTYKVKVIGLKDYQAENIFAALQEKTETQVDSDDLIPVALCPLLNGSSSLKTRVVEGFHLLNRTYPSVGHEKQQCLQAILYLLASKFLTKTDLEEVKEAINMTYLGQLIYNDGYKEGIEKGIEQGKDHGIELGKELGMECCIVAMIQSDISEGISKESIDTKLKRVFNLNDEKLDSYWKKVM